MFAVFHETILFPTIILQTFVSENFSFHSDNSILHDGMLTKVHFFDDRSVVWKKRAYELMFLITCSSFCLFFRVMFL